MDLSQLSDSDLMALKARDLSKVSDEGLMLLKSETKPIAPVTPVGERTMGTNISSDVPQVITAQNRGSVAPVEPQYSDMDKRKAIPQIAATIGSGMIAQPIGAAYGVYKGITSPNYGTQAGIEEGRQAGAELANKLQYQPTSPVAANVLGEVNDVIGAAKLPPYMGNIGTIPSMSNALRNPALNQGIREAGIVSKAVGENIKPVALNAAETMATALRKKPSIIELAPSSEKLTEESTKYFNKAKESGVELKPEYFSNMMKSVGSDLREFGYDARTMPKVAVALENLQRTDLPKDFQELSVLRRFIRNAQRSKEPDEKMVATRLKSEFDDYIANMPESSIVGGNKEGLADWKKARDTYSKLSKSEVFEDMLDKAEIRDSKLSTEQYLHNKLLQLSEDDRRMRLFTPEEQEAIKQAAKGTGMQNFMANAAKYNLKNLGTTTLGSLLGLSLAGPAGVVVAPAIGQLAKYQATKIRKNDVNKLAAMMRAGAQGATNE
jgi:hypothetical protein